MCGLVARILMNQVAVRGGLSVGSQVCEEELIKCVNRDWDVSLCYLLLDKGFGTVTILST